MASHHPLNHYVVIGGALWRVLVARNAAKEAARLRDWADIAAGRASAREVAARNAFIPPQVDLSRWTMTRIDESAWDDFGV